MPSNNRIYLSPPHMSGLEQEFVKDTFASNWIAPLGPQVDAFEHEFAERVGAPHALALSSGTAALHLALLLAGVGPGDEVFVSTLTFSASVNPIIYLGGRPRFRGQRARVLEHGPWLAGRDARRSGPRRAAAESRHPGAPLRPERRHRSDPGGLRTARRDPDRGCCRSAGRHLPRRRAGHAAAGRASTRSMATRSSPPRAAECSSRPTNA